MILCFSGTGNSRYVAEQIALLTGDTVTDMNGLIRQGLTNESISDSHIVIVAPTYAWRLPRVVEKWLRAGKIVGRSKTWFVMTCGDEIGNAAKYNRRLCESKDLEYMGTARSSCRRTTWRCSRCPGSGKRRRSFAGLTPL